MLQSKRNKSFPKRLLKAFLEKLKLKRLLSPEPQLLPNRSKMLIRQLLKSKTPRSKSSKSKLPKSKLHKRKLLKLRLHKSNWTKNRRKIPSIKRLLKMLLMNKRNKPKLIRNKRSISQINTKTNKVKKPKLDNKPMKWAKWTRLLKPKLKRRRRTIIQLLPKMMMKKRMKLLTPPPRTMLIRKKTLKTTQKRLKKRLKKSRVKIKSKIKLKTQDQNQMKMLNNQAINKLLENQLLLNKFNLLLPRDNLQSKRKWIKWTDKIFNCTNQQHQLKMIVTPVSLKMMPLIQLLLKLTKMNKKLKLRPQKKKTTT